MSHDHPTREAGGESESVEAGRPGGRAARYLRVAVYSLGVLLALSLLTVGSIAIIAELKGTWHWQLHLETTVSYMAVFVGWVLAALVPLTVLLGVVRWREGG
ncbi:hypothetical protein [Halomarina litorea]|uniref:hypothetical protein n=1 Tax=Halomarina litorea TaxID=2961595 RepID=UPI0020C38016|nr:hypothetical protein [Halomarina sp. BCD28]